MLGNDFTGDRRSLEQSVKSKIDNKNSSPRVELQYVELSEYNKLNTEINYLLKKISSMKVVLE